MAINKGSFRTSTSAATGAYRNGSPVELELVSGSMVGEINYDDVYNCIEDVNISSENNVIEDL